MVRFAIVVPIALCRHGVRAVLFAARRHLLLLRGCFLLGATICFFTAIVYIPLVDAVAITFTEPMVLLVLSALWLRERVRPSRWVAGAVGFGAVLLVVKPGASSFHPASLVALLCSIFFSLYLLSTRALQIGQSPPPTLVLLAYQCAPGAFALAACLPLVWSPFASSLSVAMGLSMGAIGACSHALLILAFEACEASFLAPLLYTEVIMQAVLGYCIWGDVPDALALVGIAVIVGCGIFLGATEKAKEHPLRSTEGPKVPKADLGAGGPSPVSASASELPSVNSDLEPRTQSHSHVSPHDSVSNSVDRSDSHESAETPPAVH